MAKYKRVRTRREGVVIYVPGDMPMSEVQKEVARRRANGTLADEPPPEDTYDAGNYNSQPDSGLEYDESGHPVVTLRPLPTPTFEEDTPAPTEYIDSVVEGAPPVGVLRGDALPRLAGQDLGAGRATNLLQGMMFDGGDEFLGAAGATLDTITGSEPGGQIGQGPPPGQKPTSFGDKFDYYQERARMLDRRMMEERPAESIATRIGGGILTGGAALPAVSRSAIKSVAPEMGSRLSGTIFGGATTPRAATLGDRVIDSAVQGGIGGGLSGFLGSNPETDGIDQAILSRIVGAGVGTGLGATVGAVATPLLSLISGGAKYAGDILGATRPKQRAYNTLAALSDDVLDITPQPAASPTSAAQRSVPGGDKVENMMLADTSPAMRQALGYVARGGGVPGERAVKALSDRQLGDPMLAKAGGGMWASVIDHIGDAISPVSFSKAIRTATAARAKVSKPLYEKAFAHGTVNHPASRDLLLIDDVRSGIAKGVELAKKFDELPAEFKLPNLNTETPLLSVQVWHAAKMGIDAKIEALMDKGRKIEVAALMRVKNKLLTMLDEATDGDYTKARETYAGMSAFLSAAEFGKKVFGKAIDIDDAAEHVAAYSPLEYEMFKAGVAASLKQSLRNGTLPGNSAKKVFNHIGTQMILGATLKKGDYQDIIGRMRGLAAQGETYAELLGSQTDSRRLVGEMMEDMIANSGDAEILANLSSTGGMQVLSRKLSEWFGTNSPRGLHQSVKGEISRMLTTTDPKEQNVIAAGIVRAAQRVLGRQRAMRNVKGGIVGGTAAGLQAARRDMGEGRKETVPPGFKLNPKDGHYYARDPDRPGRWLLWTPD